MKILLVNPSCWIYGGAERVIVQLANWLRRNHHQVTLITTQINKDMLNDLEDIRLLTPDSFQDLHEFIQQCAQDFDVINIHNEPGHLSVFPRKRNVVWMCNEPPHLEQPLPNEIDLMCVKNFKVVVADEFNSRRFNELYNIKPKIIPYGVDYDFFSTYPSAERVKAFKDKFDLNDSFVVTQVGFIADNKNQLRTIEIFRALKEKIPNAKLVLAGHATEYAEKVRRKVEEYGLIGDVILTGFVTREQVREIYYASNCALFPIKSQGGWLSVFEAMSTTKHVYVSIDATCSSILVHNVLGCVCDTDDDFVNAIVDDTLAEKKMIQRPIHLESDSLWVRDNLTWDKYCQEMVKVYEDN